MEAGVELYGFVRLHSRSIQHSAAEAGDSGRISREFAPAGEMPSGDSICPLQPEQLVKKERGKNPFRPPLWKS